MAKCTGVTAKGVRCGHNGAHVKFPWKYGNTPTKLDRCAQHRNQEEHYSTLGGGLLQASALRKIPPRKNLRSHFRASFRAAPYTKSLRVPSVRASSTTPTRKSTTPARSTRGTTPSRSVSLSSAPSEGTTAHTLQIRETSTEESLFGRENVQARQDQLSIAQGQLKLISVWTHDDVGEAPLYAMACAIATTNERINIGELQTHLLANTVARARDTVRHHDNQLGRMQQKLVTLRELIDDLTVEVRGRQADRH